MSRNRAAASRGGQAHACAYKQWLGGKPCADRQIPRQAALLPVWQHRSTGNGALHAFMVRAACCPAPLPALRISSSSALAGAPLQAKLCQQPSRPSIPGLQAACTLSRAPSANARGAPARGDAARGLFGAYTSLHTPPHNVAVMAHSAACSPCSLCRETLPSSTSRGNEWFQPRPLPCQPTRDARTRASTSAASQPGKKAAWQKRQIMWRVPHRGLFWLAEYADQLVACC